MLFVIAIGVLLAFVTLMLRRTQMPARLRSVVSVMFGFFAMALAVSLCTMIAVKAMHLTSGHPTPTYLAVSAGYSVLAALLGGWVAGDIAPYSRQIWHGAALAVVMIALSIYGLLHPALGQPLWYPFFLATVPPLAAVAGAAMAPRGLRF